MLSCTSVLLSLVHSLLLLFLSGYISEWSCKSNSELLVKRRRWSLNVSNLEVNLVSNFGASSTMLVVGYISAYISAGPRELCGAVDLISQYKLLQHHEFFCKRSLSASLSDSHYLHDVVGDAEIRKGEGMQLDQLVQNNNTSQIRESNTRIQPFDVDELKEAFQLNDMTPVELPLVSICSLSLFLLVLLCLNLKIQLIRGTWKWVQ